MQNVLPNLCSAALPVALCLLFPTQGFAQAVPEDLLDDEHVREEMGVNEITAPAIVKILDELQAFAPLEYEQLAVPLPGSISGGRVQTAMAFGNMIGDGCLIVATERSQAVEPFGRELLRLATALGVGDAVSGYSNSLLQFASRNDWQGVRGELGGMQREVERTMVRFRDEEIAHLLSLGGWLRGLQMMGTSLGSNFSAERASKMVRRDLLSYYLDRLETFRPGLQRHPLVAETLSTLRTVWTLASANDGKPGPSEIAEITRQVGLLNARITGTP